LASSFIFFFSFSFEGSGYKFYCIYVFVSLSLLKIFHKSLFTEGVFASQFYLKKRKKKEKNKG